MKSIKVLSITILICFAFSSFVNAQIKGLIRDKALEQIKNSQGKKVEEPKETQPVQEEPTTPQQSKPKPSYLEQKMTAKIGLGDVKHEQQYNFNSSMTMEIETTDAEKNKEKILYSTFFSPNEKNFALVFDGIDRETGKKQKSTIILDAKNNVMLILGEKDGEKSGMAMWVAPDSTAVSETSAEAEKYPEDFVHPWYAPTGRSKTIAGHNCKEYSYKSEAGGVDLWVTKDQIVNFSNAYGYMQGFQALASGGWAYGMGMVMEMVSHDAASGVTSHMLVKDILPNSSKTLDVSNYQIIGFGGPPK
jgi:hypothetical protein